MELNPPGPLRRRVLEASKRRRPPDRAVPPVRPAAPDACFHGQIHELHRVLATVGPGDWRRPAWPYPWTIHGLLGHLVGIETYVGGVLGLWPFHPIGPVEDHIGVTLPFVAETDDAEPCTTVGRWAARAEAVGTHLGRLHLEQPSRRVDFHGLSVSVGSLLVARAFELWTHADDIRRALDQPLAVPRPDQLHTMADLSVRLLTHAIPFVAPEQVDRPACLVLTGAGGGVWRLGPPAAPPDVLIVADIIEWCRMAARRLTPDLLGALVTGDQGLAGDLFTATQLVVA